MEQAPSNILIIDEIDINYPAHKHANLLEAIYKLELLDMNVLNIIKSLINRYKENRTFRIKISALAHALNKKDVRSFRQSCQKMVERLKGSKVTIRTLDDTTVVECLRMETIEYSSETGHIDARINLEILPYMLSTKTAAR